MIASWTRFIGGRDIPESAGRWDQQRWNDWLVASARAYFAATRPSARRAGFRPFNVEPISDVEPSSQLLDEMDRFCPSALPLLAHAVRNYIARWTAEDSVAALSFMLRLHGMLGALGPAADQEALLVGLITKLDARIPRRESSKIADEIVNAAIGRLPPSGLRKIGRAFARRLEVVLEPPWRAQIKLLDALLEFEGASNLIGDVAVVLPNLTEIVRSRIVRRRIGDVVTDRLTLPGVLALRDIRPADRNEELILGLLKSCVFPTRVEVYGDRARDKLLGDEVYTSASSGDPHDKIGLFSMLETRADLLLTEPHHA
jgi:hypothetical protein